MTKCKRKQGKCPAGTVLSIRALARGVCRHHGTVSKWLRSPKWPFGQRGPWDVAAVAAWAATSLQPDRSVGGGSTSPADLSLLAQAELQLKIRQVQKLEVEIQELKGRLHDSEECRRRRLGLIQGAKARLLDLGRSAAPDLVGLEQDGVERVLAERLCRIVDGLAGDLDLGGAGDRRPGADQGGQGATDKAV